MADEADSKSVDGNIVWVQVPLPAGKKPEALIKSGVQAFLLFSTKNVLIECDSYVRIANDKRWIVTGKAGYTTLYH